MPDLPVATVARTSDPAAGGLTRRTPDRTDCSLPIYASWMSPPSS